MTDSHDYEPANGQGLPHDPFNAIIGCSSIGWKDSVRSIEQTREFALAGLTPVPSRLIKPPRVTDPEISSRVLTVLDNEK